MLKGDLRYNSTHACPTPRNPVLGYKWVYKSRQRCKIVGARRSIDGA